VWHLPHFGSSEMNLMAGSAVVEQRGGGTQVKQGSGAPTEQRLSGARWLALQRSCTSDAWVEQRGWHSGDEQGVDDELGPDAWCSGRHRESGGRKHG
jgi:hypothetical protein